MEDDDADHSTLERLTALSWHWKKKVNPKLPESSDSLTVWARIRFLLTEMLTIYFEAETIC